MRYLVEAETLARALGDQRRLGRALAYQTDYFRLTGDRARALETGQQAMTIAEALDDLPLRVAASTWLGQVFLAQGDYAEAIKLFRRNIDALVGDRLRDPLGMPQLPAVHSRTCLAWSLAELGRFEEGIACANEAVRIAESVDQPLARVVAGSGLGYVHLRRGEAVEAIAALEPALGLVQAWGTPLWFPTVASDLGSAYALVGRLAEALPLLHQAVERAVSMDLLRFRSRLIGALGEACLAAGRLAEAEELAQRALTLARTHGERAYEARALMLLGDLKVRSGSPSAPTPGDCYREALALADERGMRPLAALCQLRLAALDRLAGGGEDVESRMEAATSELRALGMRRVLVEPEREASGSALRASG
jgi:tetratricopeptide (TPR) repeat protein